jgi:hypothetical protein
MQCRNSICSASACSQFCRLIAGNARDAWRDLYIQRPTGEWVVANRLRQEGKAKHQAYVATARGNVIETRPATMS